MYIIDTENIILPEHFNDPFCYLPHPLCVKAAEEIKTKLQYPENKEGKMFGVMIVRDKAGKAGYIAACSGNEEAAGKIDFVPQIFELLNPDDYFIAEEKEISAINRKIEEIENGGDYQRLQATVAAEREERRLRLDEARQAAATAKAERDSRRRTTANLLPETEATMARESQFQKAEIKRLQRRLKQRLEELERQLQTLENQIVGMKEERKRRSVALQRRLFFSYRVLNARGEEKSLYEIFAEHSGALPPAGAGECAAPKLLQYAYKHGLQPVAMAEFWLGRSPAGECRRHGYFYPACESKCRPILSFMLQGLDVEAVEYGASLQRPETVFEDSCIVVVDKPAGMLSVPGKGDRVSVYSLMQQQYAETLYVVHRLDMDTSGLLLIAKTRDVYKKLQRAFATRSVRKVYEAVLDGVPPCSEGIISLPLCFNPSERPRQMVSYEFGKEAVTRYKVLADYVAGDDEAGAGAGAETLTRFKTLLRLGAAERFVPGKIALVEFEPLTGRTHQIRVHAAHRDGLNVPILGDRLYGRPAARLFLHARELTFRHPLTEQEITVISPRTLATLIDM
jgi:tRNA pseudouridine32 synthase/23S rRNA pseudouridine746 synthase